MAMAAVMPVPIMVSAAAQAAADAGARAVPDSATRDSADRAADQRAGTGAERAINKSFLGLGGARGAKEPGRQDGYGHQLLHSTFPSDETHPLQ